MSAYDAGLAAPAGPTSGSLLHPPGLSKCLPIPSTNLVAWPLTLSQSALSFSSSSGVKSITMHVWKVTDPKTGKVHTFDHTTNKAKREGLCAWMAFHGIKFGKGATR